VVLVHVDVDVVVASSSSVSAWRSSAPIGGARHFGMARYEIRHADTGAVLSRHRTRQAALDRWRTGHRGIPVAIWRTYSGRAAALVVEGTWREGETEHE
jgi:hypothetical protein